MTKPLVTFLVTIVGLTTASLAVILFAKGYRLSLPTKELKATGMISAKSYPEGAKVFLNGKLVTVTNNPITALNPGTYQLKIYKEGYFTWEKAIPVYEELVTDVDALLVSSTPKLEPLTNSGVSLMAISSDKSKVAYCTSTGEKPGIWILYLASGSPINLFRTKSQLLLADTPKAAYSLAEALTWSPDDSELLIQMNEGGYFLAKGVGNSSLSLSPISNPSETHKRWERDQLKKRLSFLETVTKKLEIPEPILQAATASSTLWSPSERKFLYRKGAQDSVEYHTYSLEDPTPVGQETRDFLTLRIKPESEETTRFFWYSDDRHLVTLEQDHLLSLIEIDGANKVAVFAGPLKSPEVTATPSGDKLVILTSFNPNLESSIYTLSLY